MAYIIKPEHLAAIAGRTTPLMPDLAEWMNKLCPPCEIDTPQEYAHFLAQACHETDHFKTLREYASGRAYEGRSDLGNTQTGDGGISLEMDKLAVPTLILNPGLEGNFHDPGQNYMEAFCHKGWEGRVENNLKITVKTIPNSRACLWFDQPQEVNKTVVDFLKGVD